MGKGSLLLESGSIRVGAAIFFATNHLRIQLVGDWIRSPYDREL